MRAVVQPLPWPLLLLNRSILYNNKPRPPRFAQSTILEISPSHLPNKTFKKFISELLVTQYACANCNITTLLVINICIVCYYYPLFIQNPYFWQVDQKLKILLIKDSKSSWKIFPQRTNSANLTSSNLHDC